MEQTPKKSPKSHKQPRIGKVLTQARKPTTMKIVAVIFLVTSALLCALKLHYDQAVSGASATDHIQYLKIYAQLASAVIVGFGAALLGVLIPETFAQTRHTFERFRDSRTAYSEAKTGVDYLHLRLCTLDLKSAAAHIQRVHVKKHEAELYDELEFHLKKRGIKHTPGQWGDELYGRLFLARDILETNADKWDKISAGERLNLIREVLAAPKLDPLEDGAFDVTWSEQKGDHLALLLNCVKTSRKQ